MEQNLSQQVSFVTEFSEILKRIEQTNTSVLEDIKVLKESINALLEFERKFEPECKTEAMKEAYNDIWRLKNRLQSLESDITYAHEQAELKLLIKKCIISLSTYEL